MRTVPVTPQLSGPQNELMRAVFTQVLVTDRPVPIAAITAATGRHISAVVADVDELTAAGQLRLTPDGEPTGAFGLTVDRTNHQILIDGARRHTWCAADALGILGALGATGAIRSSSPASGQPIHLEFRDGEPCGGDLDCVVFLADYRQGTPVVDTWCPLVNFFAGAGEATGWAAGRGITGECHSLPEAATRARVHWRRRLPPLDLSGLSLAPGAE